MGFGYNGRRTDANHATMVEALRVHGWTVWDLSSAGRGVPDLLAARRGVLKLIEVKDGSKPPSQQKLKPAQVKLHAAFAAAGCPVVVLTSIDQIGGL